MGTFLEDYALAIDPTFIQRTTMALSKAGQNVSAESIGAKTDLWYGKRQAFAYQVKQRLQTIAAQVAFSITAPGALTAQSPDDAIEFTINSQWDALSGVTELDKVPPVP